MGKFKNILELTQYFSDEKTCREYLAEVRWRGKPICPYCGYDKVYRIEDGNRFKCANKDCSSKFSVTVGTIFENTNIPLQKWFIAIYLACNHKKGISSLQLGRDIGITQKSAWFVLHRIREMLKETAPDLLSNIVEIDETYLGGKDRFKHKNNKIGSTQGRSINNKTVMFGLLERKGKIIAHKIPNTQRTMVIPLIEKTIKKGSTVITDEYFVYRAMSNEYNHLSINHAQNIYVNGIVHTNTIEVFWSLFKRGIIGIYHNVSQKHINAYCNEFAYRYNNRKFSQDIIVRIAMLQSEGRRLKYKNLIAN